MEVPVLPGDAPGTGPPVDEDPQDEGPLQVSARVERWPADGPDPAVRVAVLLRNPGEGPLVVDHAEVEFTDPTGATLALDGQAPGRLEPGAESELWFYYGNAARLYEVQTSLRLTYRAGSRSFAVERRP